jgi:hypothetical protein
MYSVLTPLYKRLLERSKTLLRSYRMEKHRVATVFLSYFSRTFHARQPTVFLTYNSCLKLCYFPKKKWKNAVVNPIPKASKDPSNPSNYHKISLLSSISKVFERIILKRLNTFVSTQKARFSSGTLFFSLTQHSFRCGKSL